MWRKNVSRMIVLDTGKARHGGELFESMKEGILSNKIKAYNHYDYYTFTALTKEEIIQRLEPQPDTIVVTDPTGKDVMKFIDRTLHSDSIYQYRILENWIYDPIAYKTQIQIKAIAPVLNIYGYDNDFRGRIPLFWLMYDALNKLNKPQFDRITDLAWADFFESGSTGPAVPPKYLLATRTISVYEDEDTVHHHLTEENTDTLLSEILIEAIQHNKITAWNADDYMLQKKLPASEITKMITPKPDTVMADDPISGSETIKIIIRDFNFGTINTYKILEDWTFDPHTGQIGSRVIAIAPLQYILDETGAWKETNTMCWLRIEDVKSIIAKYEEYHPTNTIAQQIWYSYFLSGDKPGVVKTFY